MIAWPGRVSWAAATSACLLGAALTGCSRSDDRPDADAIAALRGRVDRIEAVLPGPGEVMSGIQVHFAKLRFAGTAGNWDLARFELDEIEEGLRTVAALRPAENGVDLVGLVDAFEQTQLAELTEAIEASDPGRFDRAYLEAMAMCNSCHERTGRPFLVITAPSAPPVPNQRWAPPPASPGG